MKTNKALVTLVVLLFLALVASLYYCYQSKQIGDTKTSWNSKEVQWSYEDLGTNKETWAPSTKVTVTIDGKSYNAGTYTGSCAPRSHDGIAKNEVSAISCWWAGGGDDIGVFNANGKMTIQHRTVDEGTAEEGGIIGNFETVISL